MVASNEVSKLLATQSLRWSGEATRRPVWQEVIAVTATPTDEQPVWFQALELADSLRLVPHMVVVMSGPTRETGDRIGEVFPAAIGTDGLIAASDELLVDRGLPGTR